MAERVLVPTREDTLDDDVDGATVDEDESESPTAGVWSGGDAAAISSENRSISECEGMDMDVISGVKEDDPDLPPVPVARPPRDLRDLPPDRPPSFFPPRADTEEGE